MTPPERLHTTCEGCTKYIFESLLDTITNCTVGNALIREMELLHYTLNFEWSRNSTKRLSTKCRKGWSGESFQSDGIGEKRQPSLPIMFESYKCN
jgi:hypothetical protein